MRMRK